MAHDTTILGTSYQDPYGQVSPLTEQSNTLDGLSLDYLGGNSIGTEQANFSMMGQQYLAQSQGRASDGRSSSEYWPQPISRTSEHVNTVYSKGSQGSVNQHNYLSEHPEERHTPNSLGWVRNSDFLKNYQLIIRKDKEPFLQLESQSDATADKPTKVYFHQALSDQKGKYFCLWPGDCGRKSKPFGRLADMDRHLKNVHADSSQKDSFFCDHQNCSRGPHLEPFRRKDHYRDHLRDFHKEDIGAAKGRKSAKTAKDKAKWKKEQEIWLAERSIYADSWRCAKCLVKKLVREDGWECYTCKTFCEQGRIDARMRLPQKVEAVHMDDEPQYQSRLPQNTISQAMYVDDQPQYQSSLPQNAVSQAMYVENQPQYQSHTSACETCSGSLWADNGYGQWVACIACSN